MRLLKAPALARPVQGTHQGNGFLGRRRLQLCQPAAQLDTDVFLTSGLYIPWQARWHVAPRRDDVLWQAHTNVNAGAAWRSDACVYGSCWPPAVAEQREANISYSTCSAAIFLPCAPRPWRPGRAFICGNQNMLKGHPRN